MLDHMIVPYSVFSGPFLLFSTVFVELRTSLSHDFPLYLQLRAVPTECLHLDYNVMPLKMGPVNLNLEV